MPLVRERQFNLIQFLYVVGTIVLLTAALFVALELKYAKELFAAGLFIEILVFIISLIDKDKDEKENTEEIVFPPVKKESKPKFRLKRNAVPETRTVSDDSSEMMETLQSIRTTTEHLARSVDSLQRNYQKLSDSSTRHAEELEWLKQEIKKDK